MKVVFRVTIVQVVVGIGLCLCHFAANAQKFADDFSSDLVNPDFSLYSNAIDNLDSATTVDDSGLLVNITHADPGGDEHATYEL